MTRWLHTQPARSRGREQWR